MSLATLLGIVFGLAAAAQVLATISRRIRRVRAGHAARIKQVEDASRYVRERAKASLDLKREERTMKRELVDISGSIDIGEKTVQEKKSAEILLHVLDERRNPGDHAYIVSVRHPRFADIARHPPAEVATSWAEGRRFLVWAGSPKTAAAKSGVRFPTDRGYAVGAVEVYDGNPDDL